MAHTISRRLALLLDIQIPKESLPTLHPHSAFAKLPKEPAADQAQMR
jgi:hypothetical protein